MLSIHLSYEYVDYKKNFGGQDERGDWIGLIGGVHNKVYFIYGIMHISTWFCQLMSPRIQLAGNTYNFNW